MMLTGNYLNIACDQESSKRLKLTLKHNRKKLASTNFSIN